MNTSTKPAWLQALESQSWQAELAASGLAIYGAIALGDYISTFAESIVPLFSDSVLGKLYYVIIYIIMAQSLFLITFIIHLLLRILWIGLIGLNSVFPDGINIENEDYKRSFLEKVKTNLPDLSNYNIQLDHYCSIMFSISCSAVIVSLCIAIWIVIFIVFTELLSYILPTDFIGFAEYILLVVLVVFAIVNYLLTNGSLKDTNFADKYAYKISDFFGKGLYLFTYKPIMYITYTLRTNLTKKQFGLGMLASYPILFIAGFATSGVLTTFPSDHYYSMNSTVYVVNRNNYVDELASSRILRPVIQSREIDSNVIKLFIPNYKRDEKYKIPLCGDLEYVFSGKKRRIVQGEYHTACANKYYQIFIDDIPYPDVEFSYERHAYNDEKGYLAYLNIDNLAVGRHILKIQTGYKYESEEGAVRFIPFYRM